MITFISTHIYNSEYKDQNDKKKSKCKITYFKASWNILSRKNKDIKVNYIIPNIKLNKLISIKL